MKKAMLLPPSLRAAAVLCAVLAVGTVALAAGPAGPFGPVGPIGPTGPVGASGAEPESPPPTPRANPAPRPAGNRIEVSGNTATGTRCAQDGAASVNSVDVSGARLEGRTVIVQGRNANDVRTQDCSRHTEPPAQGQGATGQTNSIRIR